MMRSLWTAASGMTSQQLNVDTISNNIANVNTTGYKKERLEHFIMKGHEEMHWLFRPCYPSRSGKIEIGILQEFLGSKTSNPSVIRHN